MSNLAETDLAIQQNIRRFANERLRPLLAEADSEDPTVARGLWETLIERGCEVGLFSAFLPRRYGGSLAGLAGALALEELGAVDAGMATFYGTMGLGITPLALSGDRDLLDRFFGEVVEGERAGKPVIFAFAISEPEAGSDVEETEGAKVARLGTVARRDGDSYVIDGRKVFCSMGNLATYITVFAALEEPSIHRWTCFVVPTNTPGFSIARLERKMGQRAAPAAELIFDSVRVEAANRVGAEGQGWELNRQTLALSRPGVGAIAVGIAQAAFEAALDYAKHRHQGGRALVDHQLIRYKLARMATTIEMARALVHQAATARPPDPKLASMAKIAGSDAAVAVAHEALQIFGGYGYMQDAPVEKLYRDARVTQIYEGTNEINYFTVIEKILESDGYLPPSP